MIKIKEAALRTSEEPLMVLLRSLIAALFLIATLLQAVPGHAGDMSAGTPFSFQNLISEAGGFSNHCCAPAKSIAHPPMQACCAGTSCNAVSPATLSAATIGATRSQGGICLAADAHLEGRSIAPDTGPPRIAA